MQSNSELNITPSSICTYQMALVENNVDGNKTISNLLYSKQQPCTVHINDLPSWLMNEIETLKRTSTTGYQYCHWTPDGKHIQSQIWNPAIAPRGKLIHLGIFSHRETAAASVILAKKFARLRYAPGLARDEIEHLAQSNASKNISHIESDIMSFNASELFTFL